MFGKSFTIGKFFGIELRVDYSWFILFALITFSFLFAYLPRLYPELRTLENISIALGLSFLLFSSVAVHEYAHAIYAKRKNLRINRITFFLFGGAAELKEEPHTPGNEFIMAAVGPLTSYLISVLFGVIGLAGTLAGVLYLEVIGFTLAILNFALATFNLLPAYPLDGGRIFRSVLWKITNDPSKSTKYASIIGVGFALLLISYGFSLILFGITLNGLWLILLGWFLSNAAMNGYLFAKFGLENENIKVEDIMERIQLEDDRPAQISPEADLMEAIEKLQNDPFLYVGKNNRSFGIITKKHIQQKLKELR